MTKINLSSALSSILAALGILIALPAQALTVAPAGNFSATGSMALTKGIIPVTCATTFSGTVTPEGAISVTSVTFAGGNFLCKRIAPVGLPWSGKADSDSQLTINGMQVTISAPLLGGLCGPIDVTAEWKKDISAAHFNHVSLRPDCTMDGFMATTPKITVTPS